MYAGRHKQSFLLSSNTQLFASTASSPNISFQISHLMGSVSSTKCTLHWAKTGIIIVVTNTDSITCFSQPNMLALIQQKNVN